MDTWKAGDWFLMSCDLLSDLGLTLSSTQDEIEDAVRSEIIKAQRTSVYIDAPVRLDFYEFIDYINKYIENKIKNK